MYHTVAYMPEYITVWCFGSMAIWIYGLWSKNCKRMGLDYSIKPLDSRLIAIILARFSLQTTHLLYTL